MILTTKRKKILMYTLFTLYTIIHIQYLSLSDINRSTTNVDFSVNLEKLLMTLCPSRVLKNFDDDQDVIAERKLQIAEKHFCYPVEQKSALNKHPGTFSYIHRSFLSTFQAFNLLI